MSAALLEGHLPSPILATPEQIAAEGILLQLMKDREVETVLAAEEKRLADIELARTPDGAARLAHAIKAWTGGLAMRRLSGDPAKPAILLGTDNTPRSWCGRDIPATGAAGDNPDHIYRGAFFDGRGRYIIRGRISLERRPVQLSFELTRGLPGRVMVSAASSGTTVRNQIDLITDDRIAFGSDGGFEIRLDQDQSAAGNHLTLIDEPLTLIIRDVLSDWRQSPAWLEIERLDPPALTPFTYEDIREKVLGDLPDYLDFWTGFPLRWMGGIAPNTAASPVPRDGGWGYQAGVRYDLSPGEVTLIRMKQGHARYLGAQVCDPWFLAPDARKHVTSLNNTQAVPQDGDVFTFVIAPEDPGVANWLDTGGLKAGMAVLRWQALPLGAQVGEMLLEARVMDRAALNRDYSYLPRLSAAEREEQRATHAAAYALRFQQGRRPFR